jgi:hypothetical protein
MGDCANVSVSASYPNPVSKGVVKWSLRSECPKPVLWSVFTSAYRKVGEWNARVDGITVLLWDLKDGKGRPMAPGVYYAVFVIDGGGRQVRPLVILP